MKQMKWIRSLKHKFTGLTHAIVRFPLTTVFLAGAAILNAYMIHAEKDYLKFLLALIFGACLSAVLQVACERFFSAFSARFALMGAGVLLTVGYALIIMPAPKLSMEIVLRTSVALFALFIALIWVPVIRSSSSFNQSFMITFKAVFNSLFFSSIMFIGISMILGTTSLLIFAVDPAAYPHAANLIFILFAPIYFLSIVPVYLGAEAKKKTQEEIDDQKKTIDKAAACPKFLEILISYILIPLIAVFTLILVIYIFKTIGGTFWTDNLLEPMLVSYAITVIVLYILSSELENRFTRFFRKVFPKILVPIVLFQITSSLLSLADTGITHTRYYVILFGIYAAIAGILLSFLPVRKNGIVAALLILFAAVSIVPPVDAFTISRTSQTERLKNVLVKNHMLEKNRIQPNSSISNKDKKTITSTVSYLYEMGYTKNIEWLPANFNAYEDFYDTFGFREYEEQLNVNQPIYLNLQQPAPIAITGADTFVQVDINMSDKNGDRTICELQKEGKTYTLFKDFTKEGAVLTLAKENQELISFHTQEIFDRFYNASAAKGLISAKEATFIKENDRAKITIVAQNVNIEKQDEQYNSLVLYVFIQIK